jgi:hypothetical protein
MADRYWVGGAGTWDGTALLKWALTSGGVGGQAVPTAADDVYFDAASGAVTITLSGARTCLSFNSTGFTGTLTGTGTLTVSANAIYGSGATFTNTGAWTFNATSGTQQITTNGKTLDFPITQNGVGGTVQLQDNLTMGSTRLFTLTNGALDLNNNTFSTGIFGSSNSNIRSIAFGTGNITLTGSGTTIWGIATATNFSYTGTPTVNCTFSGSTGTRIVSNGGTAGISESNSVSFNITAGTDTFAFSANSSYKNINFTGFAGTLTNAVRTVYGDLTFSSGMTLTAGASTTTLASTSGTKTITVNGQTIDFPITFNGVGGTWSFADALTQGSTRAFTITNGTVNLKAGVTSTVGAFVANNANTKSLQSTTPGTQATISQASGTVTVADLTIRDSNAAGGASWTAYADYENIDAGNNDGWDFSISPPYAAYEPPIIIRSFTQPRRF